MADKHKSIRDSGGLIVARGGRAQEKNPCVVFGPPAEQTHRGLTKKQTLSCTRRDTVLSVTKGV